MTTPHQRSQCSLTVSTGLVQEASVDLLTAPRLAHHCASDSALADVPCEKQAFILPSFAFTAGKDYPCIALSITLLLPRLKRHSGKFAPK